MKRVAMIVGIAIILIALIAGRERLTSLIEGPNPEKIPTTTLSSEFDLTTTPAGATPVRRTLLFDKGLRTGVTQNFVTHNSFESVLVHYKNVLPAQGWALVDTRRARTPQEAIKFCKSRMSLTIDFVEQDENATTYYVGIVWARSSRDPAFCQPA
jgi:hypothetical protein